MDTRQFPRLCLPRLVVPRSWGEISGDRLPIRRCTNLLRSEERGGGTIKPAADRAIEKTDGTSRWYAFRCQAHQSPMKVMRTVIIMTRETRQPVGQNISGERSRMTSVSFWRDDINWSSVFSFARDREMIFRSLEGGSANARRLRHRHPHPRRRRRCCRRCRRRIYPRMLFSSSTVASRLPRDCIPARAVINYRVHVVDWNTYSCPDGVI